MVKIATKDALASGLFMTLDPSGSSAILFTTPLAVLELAVTTDADGHTVTTFAVTNHPAIVGGYVVAAPSGATTEILEVVYVTANGTDALTLTDVGATVSNTPQATLGFVSIASIPLTGDDQIVGTGFADVLEGLAGDDKLTGKAGDDTLFGGNGDDILKGGAGADMLDGGDGYDRVSYSDATSHVQVYLADMAANIGYAAGDVFVGIEGIVGTSFADTITGDGTANVLIGGDRADTLSGLGGADILKGGNGFDTLSGGASDDDLSGGRGNDTLSGGTGHDQLWGGKGSDVLMGDGGDDILDGGAGLDRVEGGGGDDLILGVGDGAYDATEYVDGGAGYDIVDFSDAPEFLDIYLNRDYDYGTAYVYNVEKIIGSQHSDYIEGYLPSGPVSDDLVIEIDAGAGFDEVLVGDGNYLINGGAARDFLQINGTGTYEIYGGDGNDEFSGYRYDVYRFMVGDAYLDGEAGNDTFYLEFSDGEQEVHGGTGDDFLRSYGTSSATTTLYGDTGDDKFSALWGNVVIADWDNETLELRGDYINRALYGVDMATDPHEADVLALAEVVDGNTVLAIGTWSDDDTIEDTWYTVTLLGLDDPQMLAGYLDYVSY